MDISADILDNLHNKFVKGTISKQEKKVLYSHFKQMFTNKKTGKVDYDSLDNFLVVTHDNYKKPVNGIVSLV